MQGSNAGVMTGTHKMWLALVALAGLAAVHSHAAEVQPAGAQPAVDACASDDKLLGVSRIVEIDTQGGPMFGAGHTANDFLQDHEVVLSFDDGPLRPYTRAVLKALSDECTKATFFMVGRMAASDPAMVKEIAAQGHTIGSHTWSHKNLKPLGLVRGRQELEMGASAVTKAKGSPIAPFFRFPYLSESRSVIGYAQSRNIGLFSIDIDSKDYTTRNPADVHRRVMNGLAQNKKGIILFHDIQRSTAGAIKGLLAELHQKGYKVVHMVPKNSMDTISAYDGAAGKELTDKSDAAAANPLAQRTVTWTMPPNAKAVGKSPQTAAPAAAPPVDNASAQTTPAAQQDGDEVLPWATETRRSADARPKHIIKPKQESQPWNLMNIFQ
jgi:peptidoglycan/xylan/chitin deacetylase (PgdA/CDA1 family)